MMIGLVLVTLFAVIGIGYSLYTQEDDTPVEEVAEALIEDQIEETLHLPSDTLDIDLTPSSKENK